MNLIRPTLDDTPPRSDPAPGAMRQTVLARILAVYAILAIAWFAFPGGVVTWMDDHNRSGWLDGPRAFAGAVDAASAAVGVKQVGEKLRATFGSWLEGDQG